MAASTRRVLLIGWDGADWKVINRLIDEGKMPVLEQFLQQGVMGNLRSLYPELSPMLWTSIATGKRPYKHGIWGFTEPNPQFGGIRPISSYSRKTRALWNILHLENMQTNLVGWWPSHPAEPINGVMVSNHYQKAVAPMDQPWPLLPGSIHPRRLEKNLKNLRLHPQELTAEHIAHFVPNFTKIDQDKDRRLEIIAKIIAETITVHAAATALIQLEPWNLMGVYFNAIDHLSHGFMRFQPPLMKGIDKNEFELYKNVVDAGYRFHDMMLAAYLALAGDDATVIIISDHGFHPDEQRPSHIPAEPAGPAIQHRRHGIFAIKGPGIKQDEIIHGASLLDITPTILHCFGLPMGEDMDGVVLANIFEDPEPITAIPSWDEIQGEDGAIPEDQAVDPVSSRKAINQLVTLGYIEKPDEDMEKAVVDCIRELDYNVARSYMDAGRHYDATSYLERLVQDWPEESRFSIQLYACYKALGQKDQARKTLETAFTNKKEAVQRARQDLKEWYEQNKGKKLKDLSEQTQYTFRKLSAQASVNPFAMTLLMGSQLLDEGDIDGALVKFKEAESMSPHALSPHLMKGEAYITKKDWHMARLSLKHALTIDPDNVSARIHLCRVLLKKRQNSEAVNIALDAIGLEFANASAHYYLGVAMQRLGRPLDAIQALKVAVALNPNHVKALKRLNDIYDKRIDDVDMAARFKKRWKEAKERNRELAVGRFKAHENALRYRQALTADKLEPGTGPDVPNKVSMPLNEVNIVVTGLPRSGTSMMMQVLSAGGLTPVTDGKRTPDSHNQRGYFEDERAKAIHKDSSWLPEIRGQVVKIVAQLLNFLPAGKDCYYGVVFMERHMDEVLASQRDLILSQGGRPSNMPDILLKQTYSAQVNRIKKLLAARRIPTLCINYQDFLNIPVQTAARINAFFGGSLDETAMAQAVEPKLNRHKTSPQPFQV